MPPVTSQATTGDPGLKVGGLLPDTLDVLRRHPVVLLVPFVLLGVLTSGSGGDPGSPARFDDGLPPWQVLPILAAIGVVVLVFTAIVFLLYALAWLVTTRIALGVVTGEGAPDLRSAFDDVRPAYWQGAWTFLLTALVVIGGFILLVVPGFIALAGLFPWAAVVVAERRTGGDALRRAWDLTRGYRVDLFLLVLLAILVSAAGSMLFAWIPVIGPALAGAVTGAVYAAVAVAAVLFHARRTSVPAAPPTPHPPVDRVPRV